MKSVIDQANAIHDLMAYRALLEEQRINIDKLMGMVVTKPETDGELLLVLFSLFDFQKDERVVKAYQQAREVAINEYEARLNIPKKAKNMAEGLAFRPTEIFEIFKEFVVEFLGWPWTNDDIKKRFSGIVREMDNCTNELDVHEVLSLQENEKLLLEVHANTEESDFIRGCAELTALTIELMLLDPSNFRWPEKVHTFVTKIIAMNRRYIANLRTYAEFLHELSLAFPDP